MTDSVLNAAEKMRLTDYAREVVARNLRAGAAKAAPLDLEDPVDAFSLDGLRLRMSALEKEFAALYRRIEQSFAAILVSLERIEARAAHTSGELSAVHEELDAQAGKTAYFRDELMAAARDYGATLNGELVQLVDRLEAMSESGATKEPKTSSVGRNG